jgi:hypothetical protein
MALCMYVLYMPRIDLEPFIVFVVCECMNKSGLKMYKSNAALQFTSGNTYPRNQGNHYDGFRSYNYYCESYEVSNSTCRPSKWELADLAYN